jgi:hypothetical protein
MICTTYLDVTGLITVHWSRAASVALKQPSVAVVLCSVTIAK